MKLTTLTVLAINLSILLLIRRQALLKYNQLHDLIYSCISNIDTRPIIFKKKNLNLKKK